MSVQTELGPTNVLKKTANTLEFGADNTGSTGTKIINVQYTICTGLNSITSAYSTKIIQTPPENLILSKRG